MTPLEAAAILRQHNVWRRDVRDENPVEMLSPKFIGEAIDVVVAYITRRDGK